MAFHSGVQTRRDGRSCVVRKKEHGDSEDGIKMIGHSLLLGVGQKNIDNCSVTEPKL